MIQILINQIIIGLYTVMKKMTLIKEKKLKQIVPLKMNFLSASLKNKDMKHTSFINKKEIFNRVF